CSWHAGNERCRFPGSISSSNKGGPWYCRGHANCSDPRVGGQIVDESIAECGSRPDYSHGPREQAIRDKHSHELQASGVTGRKVTPENLRESLDGVAQHVKADT